MHAEYFKAFHDGSMASHVASQRHWIQDKGDDNSGYFIEMHDTNFSPKVQWLSRTLASSRPIEILMESEERFGCYSLQP